MDNSTDALLRDTKLIVVLGTAVYGVGAALLLVMTASSRLAFFGTVSLGLLALLLLAISR